MRVKLKSVAEIRPYERNPRINDQAVAAVAASIRQFGFRQPIVVDDQNVVIVGHVRSKAAQLLGLTEVPVHLATDLTPDQVRAFRIADNQTHNLSHWDQERLVSELVALHEVDFDLNTLGFSPDDLHRMLHPEPRDGLCDPDLIPEPPTQAATQPGDLFALGRHRLLCGDAGNAQDVDQLLDGAVVHLVHTDPPCNVRVEPRSNNAIAAGLSSYQGTSNHQGLDLARHPQKAKKTNSKLRAKGRPLLNDFVSEEAYDQLLQKWFGTIARVLAPGRSFYLWGGYANCANYPAVLKV